MKSGKTFSVVLVTAPNLDVARALAKQALEAKLIACANLLPRMESHYWWEGAVQSDPEVLLILKTKRARLKELEKLILEYHPYDTPEFLALPVDQGTGPYLDWLKFSVR